MIILKIALGCWALTYAVVIYVKFNRVRNDEEELKQSFARGRRYRRSHRGEISQLRAKIREEKSDISDAAICAITTLCLLLSVQIGHYVYLNWEEISSLFRKSAYRTETLLFIGLTAAILITAKLGLSKPDVKSFARAHLLQK